MMKFLNKWAIKPPIKQEVLESNNEIEWSFVGTTESDFTLVKTSDDVLSVKPAIFEYLLKFGLLIVGIVLTSVAIIFWNESDFFGHKVDKWLMIIFGLFLALGCLSDVTKYLFFHKKQFSKIDNEYLNRKNIECQLTDIKALQLLYKRHGFYSFSQTKSGDPNIYVYQLNLVLKNNDRVNALTHRNSEKIRNDAKLLSTFLGIPVLDGINDDYINRNSDS